MAEDGANPMAFLTRSESVWRLATMGPRALTSSAPHFIGMGLMPT